MKTHSTLIALILLAFFNLSTSCSKNSDITEPSSSIIAFTVSVQNDANFPELKIISEINPLAAEWVFPGNVIVKNKETVIYYFGEKGTYDVTLNYTKDGKVYSYTDKVNIAQNSHYFNRGEKLWWNDEFLGSTLDLSCWNYDVGSNKDQNRWGNNEWQNYTNSADNSFIRDGKLIIKAIKSGEGQKVEDYTSARLTTKDKKEFNRGRVEVRAKLGGGRGLWPAIWLYQSSWSDGIYSELDIMEYVGVDKNIIYSAVHTNKTKEKPENQVGSNRQIVGVEDNYHIYGLNWTDGKVEIYIDDPDKPHLTFTVDNMNDPNEWPFDKKLYLILNIAVGGDWGGMKGVDDTIFPQEMEIDYVRIFTK